MKGTLHLVRAYFDDSGTHAESEITTIGGLVGTFATIEGAKANGLEAKTGSLTPGKQADLILLRRDEINVTPVNDPVGAVVYGMDTSNVDSVYVGGRARKQAGQLVGADPARIAEQAITSRAYLASKVANG